MMIVEDPNCVFTTEQYCCMLSTIFSFRRSISSRVDSSQVLSRVDSASNLYPVYIATACCLFDARREAKSISSSIYLRLVCKYIRRLHRIFEPHCIHTPVVSSREGCLSLACASMDTHSHYFRHHPPPSDKVHFHRLCFRLLISL